MKQKIGTMKSPNEPITDLDVAFVAFYNLVYEKLETEPKRGLIISKGNPNQRKAYWSEVMEIAHMLEDFFILRKQRTGRNTCELCKHWESVSEASPHIGKCKNRNIHHIHKFNSCKRFQGRFES